MGLIDVREAASVTGRTPETIRRWVWSGRLPAQRRGRKIMIEHADVLRLMGEDQPGVVTRLADWRDMVIEHQRRTAQSVPGVSAADLIIQDRLARDAVDPPADAGH
jgi:excisionase family DNA binding protein